MHEKLEKAKEIFIELDGSQKWQLDKKFNITATTKNYEEYKNKLIDIISNNLDCFELKTYSYNIIFNKLKA